MASPTALNILVADDSASIRQILVTLLQRQGHQVFAAEDGVQALELFHRHKPDLILLDILMPRMDGMEVARHIRAEALDRWIPIIFLSALDRRDNLVAGLEAGADDFLPKPLDFSLLEARIKSLHKALELQRQAQQSYRQLKAISDNVLDAIVTINPQGTILSCNQSIERLFGWRPDELVGQNVNILMPEPYHGRHDGYLRNYIGGGPPNIIGEGRELPAKRKDGSVFPAELAVTEVRTPDGRQFIGLLRDISLRKEAEMRILENTQALQGYYERSEEENRLAMRLLEKQMERPGLKDPALHYWLTAAKDFSGDVVAAVKGEDGSLTALLADATGHGLTAAISTLPLLTLFYDLAERPMSVPTLLREMNRHLRAALPVGHFVATLVVRLTPNRLEGELWNGGMPTAAVLETDGSVSTTYPSRHLPLGVLNDQDFDGACAPLSLQAGQQLFLYSDGLKEAEGSDGQQLGSEGILHSLNSITANRRLEQLQLNLQSHLAGQAAKDDVSVLLIDAGKC